MDRQQLAGHLRFFQELGVTGVGRDELARPSNVRLQPEETPRSFRLQPEENPRGFRLQPEGPPPPEGPAQPAANPREALAAIRDDLGDCTRCKLHGMGRTHIVFGVGNPEAELMFIGEAPGADEDIQGLPFVGRAGQQLTKMINAMGFARDEVYIANVLKCRPPGNRNPEPDEIARCEPFLFRQIASVQPKVIVALGKFAAQALLKVDTPISRLRGRVHEYRGTRLVPTFHPSFLLRSPGYKREAWEDLKLALKLLGREPPPRPAAG